LIGTDNDRAIGRRLGNRSQLGIPGTIRHRTEEDHSWLGTDTDRVAKTLGRSVEADGQRRQRVGIRAYRDE
jgi:hypothetical protein